MNTFLSSILHTVHARVRKSTTHMMRVCPRRVKNKAEREKECEAQSLYTPRRLCVNVWPAFGRQAWQIALLGWQPRAARERRFFSPPTYTSFALRGAVFFPVASLRLHYLGLARWTEWTDEWERRPVLLAAFVGEIDSHDYEWPIGFPRFFSKLGRFGR